MLFVWPPAVGDNYLFPFSFSYRKCLDLYVYTQLDASSHVSLGSAPLERYPDPNTLKPSKA